jgi:predicted PolB exonuclease-like 3'-5' exonuclease
MSEPTFLVLDLETVVDPALPQTDTGECQALPPPPFHQIVALGVMWLGSDYCVRRHGLLAEGKDERVMLEAFCKFVSERKPDLVTFNGRGFDLPVIVARCLHHGVPFAHYYAARDVRYRFSASGHLDLMDLLTDHGAARACRLDVVARSIGMPGKVGIAGQDVGPMVHAGRLAEVQAYCLCDVAQTAAVLLRVQLVRGVLDVEGYRAAVASLLAVIDSDERLGAIRDGMDRKRLLLEPAAASAGG